MNIILEFKGEMLRKNAKIHKFYFSRDETCQKQELKANKITKAVIGFETVNYKMQKHRIH